MNEYTLKKHLEGEKAYQENDFEKAKKIFEVGVKSGSANAQYRLAIILYDEESEWADEERGYDLFQKAAGQGHKKAGEALELVEACDEIDYMLSDKMEKEYLEEFSKKNEFQCGGEK